MAVLSFDLHGPQLAWYARPNTPRGRWNAEEFGAFRTEHAMGHGEALALARADWTVSSRRLFSERPEHAPDANGRRAILLPSHVALVRDTDHRPLGVAGSTYGIAQNLDVLGRVFKRSVAGNPDGAEPTFEPLTLDSLAVLGEGGERLYAQAYLGRLDILARGGADAVDTYLSATWGHDGRTTVLAGLAMTRAVCENTMGHSLIEAARSGYRIRHTTRVKARLDATGDALSAAVDGARARADEYTRLAGVTFDTDKMVHVARAAFPSETKRATEARDTIIALFDGRADGFDLAGRTAWGAWNAVTQYVDRAWNAKESDTRVTRMLSSELSDSADEIRERAYVRVLELAS